MSNSMQHWNGHQVCAIDTETTGLDDKWHEMWQLCILPLDSNFEPRQDVTPFYIEMCPQHPERIPWGEPFMRAMSEKIEHATLHGFQPDVAYDLFMQWFDKLGLPYTRGGFRKKIIPLGHNYAFDRGFISNWLTAGIYNEHFDYHYKDTMIAAGFLNDIAAMHAEVVPYSKIKLSWLAYKMGIEHKDSDAHDALQDAIVTAKVYKALCSKGLIS